MGQIPQTCDGLRVFLSVGMLKDKLNNCMLLQFVYSSLFFLFIGIFYGFHNVET